MIKQRKRLAPTASVAYLFDVSVGTVRSWASRYGWTPYGTRRLRCWDLNQAQATFDRLEWRKTMDELVAWLREQIAAKRREAEEWPDNLTERWHNVPSVSIQGVLAECDAHTEILDLCTTTDWGDGYTEAYRDVVRLLAVPYAGRPGYREEWRPATP